MLNKAQSLITDPELELLLGCARTDVDDERANRIRALAQSNLKWERILRVAHKHRLLPLLYWQLNNICPELVPEPHFGFLQDHFKINTARNLCLTDELCKVLKLFEAHDISAIPFKGPALAASVYGNLALRQFSDLDIMIQRKDVAQASEILALQGYNKQHDLTITQETAFLKIQCERAFADAEGTFSIDLHWDFVPKYFSLRFDLKSFWEGLERTSLGNTRVLSFAPEDLLLILCINAGKGFWHRLIWLCDVNEVIKAYPRINWQVVMRRASQAGASRILYLSLLLAHDLLGADVPEELMTKVSADSKIRKLALMIKEGLFVDEVKTNSMSNFLRHAKLMGRLSDQIKFYLRLGFTPTIEDWTFINLPRPLFFLYYLTRPIRLTKKYLLHH